MPELRIKAKAHVLGQLGLRWDAQIVFTSYTTKSDHTEILLQYAVEGQNSGRRLDYWTDPEELDMETMHIRFGYVFTITPADVEVIRVWGDSVLLGL